MADIWPALPPQRAVCIDDVRDLIYLRQEDGEGAEQCICIHKSNIDRLIQQLQTIER